MTRPYLLSATALVCVVLACDAQKEEPRSSEEEPRAARTASGSGAPSALDSLVTGLRTAGGTFRPDGRREPMLADAAIDDAALRAHGAAAVRRLVDCLADTAASTTVHAEDDTSAPYPVGAICYVALNAIARPAPGASPRVAESSFLNLATAADARRGLEATQRAWLALVAADAYEVVKVP